MHNTGENNKYNKTQLESALPGATREVQRRNQSKVRIALCATTGRTAETESAGFMAQHCYVGLCLYDVLPIDLDCLLTAYCFLSYQCHHHQVPSSPLCYSDPRYGQLERVDYALRTSRRKRKLIGANESRR